MEITGEQIMKRVSGLHLNIHRMQRQLVGGLLIGLALTGMTRHAGAQDLEGVGEGPAVTADGNAGARMVAYAADGTTRRRTPFSYVLSGAVNVNLYDLAFPFSFTFSEQERQLSQPFNQFGASPRYRWATAHLGYRNLTFSPFTMAGHQILGAGVELNPGNFRLGFIAGRLNRAVEEDTTTGIGTPAYERTGFSGRIGYGSEATHIDLIVLKAQDDSSSLGHHPIFSDVRPAENLVLGASGRATIIDGLSIHGDFAVSDYTRDIRSDVLDLPAEAEALSDVIAPRASTQIYTALTTGIALNIGTFNMGASYSRIDPDYKSMGAYYLANDLESFTVTPSVGLLENTLYLNGSFSMQTDNLQGKKLATTRRLTPSLTVAYSPTAEFGITTQFNDMITSQEAGRLPLNDTIRMAQRSPMVMLSPRYTIGDSTLMHNLYGAVTWQGMVDNNSFTSEYTEYNSIGADLSYNVSFPASGLSLGATVTTHRLENFGGDYTSSGFSLNGATPLLNNTLNVNAAAGISFHADGGTVNATAGAGWKPTRHHTINLNLSLTASRPSDAIRQSINEYITVLSYVYTF